MKGPIQALVVDDERFSREELIYLLKQHEAIQVIGEAESGDTAIMKVLQLQPDVLFLDVEMPRMDGMEVAKAVQELKKVPKIVFATAYPDFAVDAFRHDAIDYLLKPFDETQLKDAVVKLEKRFAPQMDASQTLNPPPSKLAVEGEDNIHYLNPENIVYVYREERWTKIVGKPHTYKTRAPLKEIEHRLRGFPFFRIHKSYLVNLDYVDRLTPWFNGAYQLELQGREEKLSVSRNYVKDLRKQLEL